MTNRVLMLGGIASSLIDFRGPLLKLLKARGHEVFAAAQPDAGQAFKYEQLGPMGIPFFPVPIMRGGLNPLEDLRTWQGIRQLLVRCRPDVLIAYTAKPVIYGGMAARALGGIRFFPMITGLGYAFTEVEGFRRRMIKSVVKGMYRQGLRGADTTIFQNPDDQALFHSLGLIPSNCRSSRVYGSGVDRLYFSASPLPEAPNFLMLSRLVADKGICQYIEAARRVKERFPEARFRLAGDLDPNPSGVGRQEVESWVREGTIEYLGNLVDVRPALADCRYFVLPSYREGTPRSVLEAMATGRPIITTNAPGCRETVVDGVNGFLVEPRSVDSLADAMQRLLELDDRHVDSMGQESLRLVQEYYDVDRVNRSILEITGL